MSNLLHLRDLLSERKIDADLRLPKAVADVGDFVEAVCEAEGVVASVRPNALVRRIEEFDRRIEEDTDVDSVGALMEKKVALRAELEARDGAQIRLQQLAQSLLESAAALEEIDPSPARRRHRRADLSGEPERPRLRRHQLATEPNPSSLAESLGPNREHRRDQLR